MTNREKEPTKIMFVKSGDAEKINTKATFMQGIYICKVMDNKEENK